MRFAGNKVQKKTTNKIIFAATKLMFVKHKQLTITYKPVANVKGGICRPFYIFNTLIFNYL